MKTFVWIVLTIVVVFYALSKFAKFAALSSNPIDSIDFDSCLGFKLGDNWKLVLNRMLHLKLITKEEYNKYYKEYKEVLEDDGWLSSISFDGFKTSTHFNNIEYIKFQIFEGVLCSITIQLIDEQADFDFLCDKIRLMLNQKFREEGYDDGKHELINWSNHRGGSVFIALEQHFVCIINNRYRSY